MFEGMKEGRRERKDVRGRKENEMGKEEMGRESEE